MLFYAYVGYTKWEYWAQKLIELLKNKKLLGTTKSCLPEQGYQPQIPFHILYNFWLVSCSFLLSRLFSNIFCLSSSMKLGPGLWQLPKGSSAFNIQMYFRNTILILKHRLTGLVSVPAASELASGGLTSSASLAWALKSCPSGSNEKFKPFTLVRKWPNWWRHVIRRSVWNERKFWNNIVFKILLLWLVENCLAKL